MASLLAWIPSETAFFLMIKKTTPPCNTILKRQAYLSLSKIRPSGINEAAIGLINGMALKSFTGAKPFLKAEIAPLGNKNVSSGFLCHTGIKGNSKSERLDRVSGQQPEGRADIDVRAIQHVGNPDIFFRPVGNFEQTRPVSQSGDALIVEKPDLQGAGTKLEGRGFPFQLRDGFAQRLSQGAFRIGQR